jgi:hypothetical protein
MKTSLFFVFSMVLCMEVKAYEVEFVEQGLYTAPNYEKIDGFINQNEKDIKILNLTYLLERQEKMYHDKITYLEKELKKSNEKIVALSLNSDRHYEMAQKKSAEETNHLKKEIIAKTKTIMEFQRQLEKVQPGKDVQKQIIFETQLAVENRRTADQLAINNLLDARKLQDGKDQEPKRMPASVGK